MLENMRMERMTKGEFQATCDGSGVGNDQIRVTVGDSNGIFPESEEVSEIIFEGVNPNKLSIGTFRKLIVGYI